MKRLQTLLSHVQTAGVPSSMVLPEVVVGAGDKEFINPTRFAKQVAAITGGAQGLGFSIAERLVREGAALVLLDLNKELLKKATEELKKKGVTSVTVYELDVADEKQTQKVYEAIGEKFGRLDILVQAAGITGKTGVMTQDVDVKDFEKVFAVNSRGVFLGARYSIPLMLKHNYGRIVNIASVSGKEGNAGMLAYSASKAAVIGLTKVIGKELAETGITCNAIAPAVVRTAMVSAMPEQQVKYMTDKIPMKRCGTLEEIAALVSFISSPEASFTTAFAFDATGGRATY